MGKGLLGGEVGEAGLNELGGGRVGGLEAGGNLGLLGVVLDLGEGARLIVLVALVGHQVGVLTNSVGVEV